MARYGHTNKTRDDEVDAPTVNSIGTGLDANYDNFAVEHDPSDGSHNTLLVAKGAFHVSENSGTYTLETSSGIVTSRTDNGTGDVSINLSSNLDDDGSGNYEYIVEVTLLGEPGSIYADTLAAGSFKVKMTDMDGNAADRAFMGVVYGVLA